MNADLLGALAMETLEPGTLALELRGSRLGGARTLADLVRELRLLAFLRHGG